MTNKKLDKRENPARTLLGINNKQLIVLVGILLVAGAILVGKRWLVGLSLWFFIIIYSLYYVRNRRRIIADFASVKLGKIPLLPGHTHNFSWTSSIIMIIAIFVGTYGIVYLAGEVDYINDFFAKIGNFIEQHRGF